MSDEQYLIFGLHGSQYGINATSVAEIFALPELCSLATAPRDIIGMFHWRSKMVPMMHLDLRFGRRFSGCSLSDRVIIIQWEDIYIGIVAHEVYDVQELTLQLFNSSSIEARQSPEDRVTISGIGQFKGNPVVCLDLDRLIREPTSIIALEDLDLQISGATDFYSRCYPQATVADRAILASRAERLKVGTTETESTKEGVILVVQIGSEYIGLPMELVIDVDTIDRFSLSIVPVAPSHILGQINWRGEVLPILELGDILKIEQLPRQEFVVVKINNMSVGIAVDRIFDVFDFVNNQIEILPIAVTGKLRTYLSGVTKYDDNLMYLLKLQQLIEGEFLSVSI